MSEKNLPGGEMSSRKLDFFWIADCSGSMNGEKIQTLNYAIRQTIPDMRKEADANPNADILVRAVKFSDGASWHVAGAVPIDQFNWTDLSAGGVTAMGMALELVAAELVGLVAAELADPVELAELAAGDSGVEAVSSTTTVQVPPTRFC